MIETHHIAAFHEHGFATVPNALDGTWRQRLMDRAASIVEAFDAEAHRTIFSTRSQTADDYFLASANGIACFFEEEALTEDGRLRQAKARSINKIGHALHRLDSTFSDCSAELDLEGIAAALGQREPKALQSMFIFKQPRIGGEVGMHQDATFLYTEPQSVLGCWFALEDATIANGCLWTIPGAHREGLQRRWRRGRSGFAFDELEQIEWPEADAIPLEVEAGTLVLLHGLLPHRSAANRTDRSRQAYAVHLVDGAATYPADNWLQPKG